MSNKIESNKIESNKIESNTIEVAKRYFANVSGKDLSKIQITTEGLYSISENKASEKLVYLIHAYFKSYNITITDATANNGSDSIALALKFKHVNSIELDKINFSALENNVKNVYKLNNVDLYNKDSVKYLNQLTQDVIYIDPPWGGKDYKKHTRLELFMSGKNMGEIYKQFKSHTKLIVFKLPKNYDFTNFIQTTMVTKYYIYLYKNNDKPKFFLLFVPCKNN